MALLVDIFGYLSVILHGLVIVAQSMTLGGLLFLVFLLHPLSSRLTQGDELERRVVRLTRWSAWGLLLAELATTALQVSVLMSTVDLPFGNVMQASFAVAGSVKIACALVIALSLGQRTMARPLPRVLLLLVGLAELAAATATTHAYARLDDNTVLMLVEGLHQFGAAIWIGAIPCFVLVLRHLQDADSLRLVGSRFSRMSIIGVACILVSGITMWIFYVGDAQGFYGTAYGVMVGAKVAMFIGLLGLGLGNFLVTERLRKGRDASVTRMRRFAEVEIGIGFTIFFAAASLTSVPPAVDLTTDRVTLHEIAVRNAPAWPRLSSPDHDTLAISQLQTQLDQDAAREHQVAQSATIPGSGILPPRNAEDIAWSEYNHHWAGIFVLLIGFLALLNRAGMRWARHWPLLFLLMAGFLLVRSDPEVWPLGQEGWWIAWRDVEVAQHRFFVALIILFGAFEWSVRTGRLKSERAALVFPLLVAVGGAMLLTHSHQISNVKDQMLIELTHTPLALAGVAAGWARWLELRLPGRGGRIAGYVWPACFMLIGVILLWYREA
ncbi:putative copper resistance protein D [Dyella jiangningensis]|uniref:copper resistance D family protein n=1 Tax=Dyella sp. AtDHG13 TaxID=1938897 RepID=UPI00088D0A3D|nr:CopD family protein [Dyella sp. AtDHG13]PXV60356.1 putative copper resistance protein D [Dyella sp. AtDHG13]SDJ42108.1 putative copper resistance protein D [Dyella jiangningensis]